MNLSKKETHVLIELFYSIILLVFFIPTLYKERHELLTNSEVSFSFILSIVITSVIYFIITFSIVELLFKKKKISDERDTLIDLKIYKLGYYIYEIVFLSFIFSVIGLSLITATFKINVEDVIFYSFAIVVSISIIKSLAHITLYRRI